ncbi:ferrochelatase [Alicyclobacillus mengziensis]|uniref:Coproporphyrin III ferrochelatase n=1 Tax=Alicyclobacillus mengziensis TaxID=2931921 RepID=A0A9X7Z9S2_9BACL|nr:ferrochelatase [Alicyclobacillus mengziensis]QSO49936.1 ferrochelatase [Alicyclobacillus mengziensis]
MLTEPIGVLVMAYGTPRSLAEVEPYYTHIRHGRKPTPALLDNLIERYRAIGGVSPLNDITSAQASGIEHRLNRFGPGTFKVYLGMKHASPFIADAVVQMARDGIRHAVSLVLAPHYSTMSVKTYQKEADDKAAELGIPSFVHVDSWHLEPLFIDLLADRVKTALKAFAPDAKVRVLFSAHSLPERILSLGDPYPQQLRETGDTVAKQIGLTNYSFAWQSAGRTDEKWLGPDILNVLRELHDGGEDNVVVCPAGFVSDHLEVLYDVDIECQATAQELGMHLTRTESLNADPRFLDMLSAVVLRRAEDLSGSGQ